MLVPELKPYTAWLDERNYLVQLNNKQDYYANLNFDAEDYFSLSWMNDYWQKVFKYKISVSGITLRPGMRVLDICCGRGELGSFLEQNFNVEVVYCDISLKQLINKFEKKGLFHAPLFLQAPLIWSSAILSCITLPMYLWLWPKLGASKRQMV
jgi:SAM-dependent methyltransferase